MKWAHLPVGGGLYDQHPKYLDDMYLIMSIEAKNRAEEAAREKAKAAKSKRPGMASSPSRSRGRRR